MTTQLQNEIHDLKMKLLALSAKVESNVSSSVKAIVEKDESRAKAVIASDHEVDKEEVIIEEDCLKILALHQPVAVDLRMIISILKINNDLERIGDLSVNIASQALVLMKDDHKIDFFPMIEEMAERTQVMLKLSLDSLIQARPEVAQEVLAADDQVDHLHRNMYSVVIKAIQENPDMINQDIRMLSVSRYLERIADHATNIAEDIIYLTSGQIVRHGVAPNEDH